MEIIRRTNKAVTLIDELAEHQVSRRKFMRFAGLLGATAAVAGVQTGCKKHDNEDSGINLGSGDAGILNYAYALEQLEAAFYTKVVASTSTGLSTSEMNYFKDIRDHEIAHREFFKNALGSNAIPALDVNFSAVNFNSRDSILTTSKAFEDLGVSAYNGAGPLLKDANNLLLAGKIVSVEARHAALIRDLISNGTFADNTAVDSNGLDLSRIPSEVLAIAGAYFNSKLNASNLPS